MKTVGASIAAASVLLFFSAASAQNPDPMMPHEQTRGAVAFVSGGIGSDEAQAMKEASARYPLTIEMAAAGGGPRDEYISGARVRISDNRGTPLLDTRSDGPFLLARVPTGRYDVDVEWNGAHQRRSVEVGDKPQHVMVEFPGSLDTGARRPPA